MMIGGTSILGNHHVVWEDLLNVWKCTVEILGFNDLEDVEASL